jgi:hypothetical protein
MLKLENLKTGYFLEVINYIFEKGSERTVILFNQTRK